MPVEEIRPSPVPAGRGSVDAATALVTAGGVPRSAPDSPLLVLVNDPDRATRSAEALRAIRDAVRGRLVHVLVATGSHRWSDEARAAHDAPLRAAIGDPSSISWHDATGPAHRPIGPVRLDPALVQARDVIAVGSVEPHWFAGLTGAHKTLTVGMMRREDIEASHSQALDPAARPFRLSGNPVHEGFARVIEALSEGRRIVALQHVLSRWFAGPPLECLDAAAPLARARWLRRVPRPFDFLVASVESPLSHTLYQAEKGIKNNEFAVRDGGTILLDADCRDGLGPARFFEMLLRAPDVTAARNEIVLKGYRLGDHKAYRLRALEARGVHIGIVSASFPVAAAAAAGFLHYRTRDEAADALRAHYGPAAHGAVVEDAGHMVVET